MPRAARNTDIERLRILKSLIQDDAYVSEAVRVLATDLSQRLAYTDVPESSASESDGLNRRKEGSDTFHVE